MRKRQRSNSNVGGQGSRGVQQVRAAQGGRGDGVFARLKGQPRPQVQAFVNGLRADEFPMCLTACELNRRDAWRSFFSEKTKRDKLIVQVEQMRQKTFALQQTINELVGAVQQRENGRGNVRGNNDNDNDDRVMLLAENLAFMKNLFTEAISQYENDKHECSICQETIRVEQLRLTDCGHLFHSECLGSWEAKLIDEGQTPTCPECRKNLKNEAK